MDDQVIDMIRDQLNQINDTCQGIRQDFAAHVQEDKGYWQKVDQNEGALSVWKWVAGLGGGSGALAFLSQWFGKH